MRRMFAVAILVLSFVQTAQARGLLIPTEKSLPPLAMLNHQVNVAIDEQVAITHIEQTFRNHTDRQLEAEYVFPIPKGASVRRFSMWIDGKEVPGELVEADKVRKIYTDIVQRTQDPGLLEYMGNNLLKLRVFPVPPKGDQKISVSYTSVASSDNGLVEFVYPMRTDGKAASTLERFGLNVTLKSQHPIQNIYSPTHAITMTRPSDRQALVGFEKDQAALDKDFQLFYTISTKDVGLNVLTHRPIDGKPGHFMLLMSPRAELSKTQQVPRDMVFVLDTSGSMRGKRMTQARSAMQYCLNNLNDKDRFVLLNFATTVTKYSDNLQLATKANVAAARKWVDDLEATGGTAINDALSAALDMRTKDTSRTFTIVFFTDGRPTIGETNGEKILQNVAKKNTSNTRVFTFGVGDDVNATMLDQLAESTRAIATYVREAEDIEAKVSSLYGKISNPVLANLKMSISDNVKLSEVYPPQLPDLFHGSQLVMLGRFDGKGKATITLTGYVGSETKEFTYDVTFPDQSAENKPFVEDLWARRKVGYLLDQIRVNGEKKELVDEVVGLAKRHGITTPYTSYLVVPDAPVPVAAGRAPGAAPMPDVAFAPPPALAGGAGGKKDKKEPQKVADFIKGVKVGDGKDLGETRGRFEDEKLEVTAGSTSSATPAEQPAAKAAKDAREQKKAFDQAREKFARRDLDAVQNGQLGVDLSVQTNNLRNQERLLRTASRLVQNRNCIEVGGVWIDDGFDPKMPQVTVKAQSKAYFRILERQPSVKEVFQLGNHLVWVTPSGTALIIDQGDGREDLPDVDIDRLFVAAKKK